MKRLFDLTVALVATVFLALPYMFVALAVRLTSPRPVLYWSDRVGCHNRIFKIPKLRSMRINTPAVVASLLQNPDQWLTPVGSFLRKSNLDELPQLRSILKGEVPPGVLLWTKYLLWLRRNSQPNIALSSFYGRADSTLKCNFCK